MFRYLEFFQYGAIFIGLLFLLIYLAPVAYALMAYEKRNWLESFLLKVDVIPERTRSLLAEKARASNRHILYKGLMLYLGLSAAIFILIGFDFIVEDIISHADGNGMKTIIFTPLLFSLVLFVVYLQRRHSYYLKELATAFLFLGFTTTFIGFFSVYEIEAVRGEFQLLIGLLFGLFLVYTFKSTLAAYVWLLVIIVFMLGWEMFGGGVVDGMLLDSSVKTFELRNDILHQFIWVATLGLGPFVISQVKKTKVVEVKEWLLATLFASAVILATTNCSGRFEYLALAMVLAGLYMVSKAYFEDRSTWLVNRPLQTIVIVYVIYSGMSFSLRENAISGKHNYQISDFTGNEFMSLLIMFGILYLGLSVYHNEIKGKRENKLNYFILGFPFLLFLSFQIDENVTYIMSSIVTLIIIGKYLYTGALTKNAPVIFFAAMAFTSFVTQKLTVNADSLTTDAGVAGYGLIIMLIGGVFAGMAFYLNSKWKYESIHGNDKVSKPPIKNDPNVLDNPYSDDPDEISGP